MAFVYTWNATFETLPADSDDISDGASRIRDLKKAISERAEIDHNWNGGVDDGKHKQVTFGAPLGTKPTLTTDEGAIYTKTVSGISELFFEDENGTETQITAAGLLSGSSFFFGDIALDTDSSHDVKVDPTTHADSTKANVLTLLNTITKQLDAEWAAGDDAGGLGSAQEVSDDTNISFNNATSKIVDDAALGTKFNNFAVNDEVIVAGSPSNSQIFTVTAVAANDVTVSPAPTTEAAGNNIDLTLIKANRLYNVFSVDDGAGGTDVGFDLSITASGLLARTGGSFYRAIAYFYTNSSANISELVTINDKVKKRIYTNSGSPHTWRKPAMLRRLREIFCVGSGQAGGGITALVVGRDGGSSAGSGWKYNVVATALGATETVTVPAGVTGTSSNPGGNGSAASFGSLLTANGGANLSPGTTSGADISVTGQLGEPDWVSGSIDRGGAGGSTPMGLGGQVTDGGNNAGKPATGYGAGGGGACTASAVTRNGGNSAPGLCCIVEEFA